MTAAHARIRTDDSGPVEVVRDRAARLAHVIDEAAEVLPSQPPIRLFVHHNTLHAYEHMHFEEAVALAADRFGAEPYETEEAFARHLSSGRIRPEDIDAVLAADGASETPLFEGGPSERRFKFFRLQHLFEIPRGPALSWILDETDALRVCHPAVGDDQRRRLRGQVRQVRAIGVDVDADVHNPTEAERHVLAALWQKLRHYTPSRGRSPEAVRPREVVLDRVGVDTDDWVNPLLTRVCAAFVDQGISYWRMPFREMGLYEAFRRLYGQRWGPPNPWLAQLTVELNRQASQGWGALDVVASLLDELGCAEEQWAPLLEATLLALPGWGGMIRQLELRPDRAPVQAPPAKLIDFLAVRLTLDVVAARHALGARHPEAPLMRPEPTHEVVNSTEVTYEAFVCAQLLGLGPADFSAPDAEREWLRAVAGFDSFERRKLLHRAYERRHRIGVLDGLLNHARLGHATPERPRMQAVFCIDEREESLRRHLEELMPEVETFGYAGFYGVAMAYQGAEDIKPSPLCPVPVTPQHLVREVAVEVEEAKASGIRARVFGALQHWLHIGSMTAFRGGMIAALIGLVSVVPLVLRCLFPRAAERFGRHAHRTIVGHPPTRLQLERADGDEQREGGLLRGFTISEMANIVAGALRTMGACDQLSPLFLVVGHGSSSLNNPHEAAHDCGACGGGRGGPNARAFAVMANHPKVRAALKARHGLDIPKNTWFVGAYHNTCDDAIIYYDTDLVPESHRADLAAAQATLDRARRLDAHERCRRFEDTATTMGIDDMLASAEAHAVDLGQPRPEYGHATNAVCFVGRRSSTRGLFLDRRAFLVSYDPTQDPNGELLGPLLQSVGPVGAGINLEYYFSFVDNHRYGCGTKLPHNITGLIGVMDGHASDLRTGLPWQMVEIHEPVRLLTIVEVEFDVGAGILEAYPAVANLVANGWIQLVVWSPSSGEMRVFEGGRLVPYQQESQELPIVLRSVDHYAGRRGHLECARIEAALQMEAGA
ncbi:YbcC family protein [Haliangium sp.]|uniref:YbcC family protein n=1 Tax=Haliangium sp. TaxID=2663208 RepID=UPI003D0B80BE